MNRIFVCFTCSRDLPLLSAHYAAIMHLDPEAKVYYVFEPDDNPQGPMGSTVVTANFPHNGNLIGLQCHYGMLMAMKDLAELNENCDVVKIDSDCFLINDFPDGYELIGTAPGRGYYAKGCCYRLSYKCICNIIDYILDGYVDENGRCEDHLISMIAAIVSDANKVKILNAIDYNNQNEVSNINSCIFQSQYYSQPDVLQRVKFWIDCGDPVYLNDYKESNLPAPLAKARALDFLVTFFAKKKNRT